jgi:hypothetical protein
VGFLIQNNSFILVEHKHKKKFFVYVDESGQDTEGMLFVVGIFIVEEDKNDLSVILEKSEAESRKKNLKWNKSKNTFRKKYIEKLLTMPEIKGDIFFDVFRDSKEYIGLTSFATARAILRKAKKDNYRASIFVDGLKKKEVEAFSRGLRDLRIQTRKIRGVKKDENNVFIRLADALCGLVRDANDGNKWAEEALKRLIEKKIVTKL